MLVIILSNVFCRCIFEGQNFQQCSELECPKEEQPEFECENNNHHTNWIHEESNNISHFENRIDISQIRSSCSGNRLQQEHTPSWTIESSIQFIS